MRSLTHEYLASLRWHPGRHIAHAGGGYQGKPQLYVPQSPEALKELCQIAVVESTESSNRLEVLL